MSDFIAELKRRNVFRVGAVYAVVGWLLIQISGQIFPTFGAPEWVPKVFIVLVALGFFIALLLAWAFEMTPDGVKKTQAVAVGASITPTTGRKLDFAIIGALALALGYFVWESRFADAPDIGNGAPVAAASIAVLPFINMSSDPEQEYFSDGISEEILNVLAKVPDLRVTSRSSAFTFKGRDVDIPTVAKQLGVNHVLEGSVRKSGLRVRITAQLIDARTDKHLWSETYDRKLTDIFAVQDEIATAIVAALSKTMGLETKAAPQVTAVAKPEAHDAYLLGRYLIRKRNKVDIEAAIPHFERALELDPDYAPAHAGLGLAWFLLERSSASYGTLTLKESLARALPHIERALALDPASAEAQAVKGLTLAARKRFDEAIGHYRKALRLNPSLTNVRNWYSQALNELRRPAESFQQLKTAYRLDPLSVLSGGNYAEALLVRRRFDALKPLLARLGEIAPMIAPILRGRTLVARQRAAEGMIELLRGADASPANSRLKTFAALGLQNGLGLGGEGLRLWPFPDDGWPVVQASTDYEGTLTLAQKRFQDDPDDPETLSALAWAYFETGDEARAEELAGRYLSLLGPPLGASDIVNYIFVVTAWKRRDRAAMSERLGPLEAALDAELAGGIDLAEIHWPKAQLAFLRGASREAYKHADRALSINLLSPRDMAFPYRHLGWDKIPRFAALRDRYQAHMAAERAKFLAVACGEDGFKSWHPLPQTCPKG